jgi:hypothetical protein
MGPLNEATGVRRALRERSDLAICCPSAAARYYATGGRHPQQRRGAARQGDALMRKVNIDFSMTEKLILGACWAARDGDAMAQRVIGEWLKTDMARKIIRDFNAGKYRRPRGMPKGRTTKKGDLMRWILDAVIPDFIEKNKGSAKPVYDGVYEAAMWLCEQGLNFGLAKDELLTKLLAARRRGSKKKKVAGAGVAF